MGSKAWTRGASTLVIGVMAWTICLGGQSTHTSGEVFVWVADRDADCVVALDSVLMQVESREVCRPTALVVQGGEVFVISSRNGSESWLRLESGFPPAPCVVPERARGPDTLPDHPRPGLQGEPTAWARARARSLIATPGAVHLYSEDGELRGVQGGFRWISAVATLAEVHEVAQGLEP